MRSVDARVSDAGPPDRSAAAKPVESFCMIGSAVVREYGPKIGAIPLAVYAVLSEHANKSGECWPSYDTIAKMIALSRPTVIKAIKTLAAAGLVEVIRRRDDLGRDRSHSYRLPKLGGVKDFYPEQYP